MNVALSNSLHPKQKLEVAGFYFSSALFQGKSLASGYKYFKIFPLSFLGLLDSFIFYTNISLSIGGTILPLIDIFQYFVLIKYFRII